MFWLRLKLSRPSIKYQISYSFNLEYVILRELGQSSTHNYLGLEECETHCKYVGGSVDFSSFICSTFSSFICSTGKEKKANYLCFWLYYLTYYPRKQVLELNCSENICWKPPHLNGDENYLFIIIDRLDN